jgi:hypothetical protein
VYEEVNLCNQVWGAGGRPNYGKIALRETRFTRKEFRTPKWVTVLVAFGLIISTVGSFTLYQESGLTLIAVTSVILSVLFFAGFIDVMTTSVLVEEDSLIITSNFKRSKFARSSLVAVSYAKGCPVSLERAEGGWIHLPGTIGGLGLVNTLRAWLKRSSQNVERESSEREAATTPS